MSPWSFPPHPQAVQQQVAALLQQLQVVASTAACSAHDLQSAAHTAELDAEQLRQEIIARNQADRGNGMPGGLFEFGMVSVWEHTSLTTPHIVISASPATMQQQVSITQYHQ